MSVGTYAMRYEVGRTYRYDFSDNVIRLNFMTIKRCLDYDSLADYYYAWLIGDGEYGGRLRYLVARIDWLLIDEPEEEENDTVIMTFHLRKKKFYDELLENIERMTELKFYEVRENDYRNWEVAFKGKFDWKTYEVEHKIVEVEQLEGSAESFRDRL